MKIGGGSKLKKLNKEMIDTVNMETREPKWLEGVHKRTGIPKEELKKKSWTEIERYLGIVIKEPPKELKSYIKGGYFAKRKHWLTQKEIDSLHEEVDRIAKKYGFQPRHS